MKKVVCLLLVLVLVVCCTVAFAVKCKYSYCNAENVGGTRLIGFSDPITYTHQYGGFLGLFTSTCTVTYQYAYMGTYCQNDHLQYISTWRGEDQHSSCGK